MTHSFDTHVYYEDTDLAGIVYYANYFRFIERARTEYVRAIGIDQTALRISDGIVFAVRRVEAEYLKPAHFDDDLTVLTSPISLSTARIVLDQAVLRGQDTLFTARVTLVALSDTGRATRIPAEIRESLAAT